MANPQSPSLSGQIHTAELESNHEGQSPRISLIGCLSLQQRSDYIYVPVSVGICKWWWCQWSCERHRVVEEMISRRNLNRTSDNGDPKLDEFAQVRHRDRVFMMLYGYKWNVGYKFFHLQTTETQD